jgi:hypothetical protein
MGEKIIIFGTGHDSWEMYLRLRGKFAIQYMVDSKQNTRFNAVMNGFAIYHPDKLQTKPEDVKIVISSAFHCSSMASQLEALGFKYEKDYLYPWDVIPTDIIYCSYIRNLHVGGKSLVLKNLRGRKLAIIHGNCQTDVYKDNICTSKQFSESYLLLKTASVIGNGNDVKDMQFLIETGILNLCDLFITQSISTENRIDIRLSTEYIVAKLPKSCKIVKIPNFYFQGYLPQTYIDTENQHSLTLGVGDKNIDKYIKSGLSDVEILSKISDEDYYTDQIITDAENELKLFFQREREQGIDVLVDDYIWENYRRKLLFYDKRHLSECLSEIFINKLLDFLDIKNDAIKLVNATNNYTRFGIYPSVIKVLGLPNEYNNVLYSFGERIPSEKKLNFRQISQLYIDVMRGVMADNENK